MSEKSNARHRKFMYLIEFDCRIRSDHSEDDSSRMLREWVDANREVYHNIDLVISDIEKSKKLIPHTGKI